MWNKITKEDLIAYAVLIPLAIIITITAFYGGRWAEASQLDKVTICHATESETNPYNQIVVDSHAIGGHFENNGTPKAGHEEDLLFEGEVDCPGGDDNGGGGGGDDDDGGGSGGGGDDCDAVGVAAENFAVDTGTPNDNTLELSWDVVDGADLVEIRYGNEDGVWTDSVVTEDDGEYSLGGLTNGVHYWLQIRAYNECSDGVWSESVDPLP